MSPGLTYYANFRKTLTGGTRVIDTHPLVAAGEPVSADSHAPLPHYPRLNSGRDAQRKEEGKVRGQGGETKSAKRVRFFPLARLRLVVSGFGDFALDDVRIIVRRRFTYFDANTVPLDSTSQMSFVESSVRHEHAKRVNTLLLILLIC